MVSACRGILGLLHAWSYPVQTAGRGKRNRPPRIKESGRLERAPSRPPDVSVRFGQDRRDGRLGQDLRKAGIVFDNVTITYRGATYEIGRGWGFYGVWPVGGPRSRPLERWPESPEGWTAAWTRFVAIEAPDTIVPVGRNTPPVGAGALREDGEPGPFGDNAVRTPAGAALSGKASRIMAAALLGAGVILGIAGLFPAYIGRASLAQQPDQVIPHAIYLATWAASAVLILLGGTRLRIGALLSLGLTAVTFGLFLADAGTAISAAGNAGGGAGLVLSLIGWVACAAGTVVAF